MKEAFLHFIWQFQQFNKNQLLTSDGDPVSIFATGHHNPHAGPDFLEGKIQIADITWHGQIEIHTKSSEWNRHGHQQDPAYNNVILHVVWENDQPVYTQANKPIPTLELKTRVSRQIIDQCSQLLNSPESIPCSNHLPSTPPLHITTMQQYATIERLKHKAEAVLETHQHTNNSWEETAYRILARNYGFKTNSDPFAELARRLPLKYLIKHAQNLLQVEALLFGMAGYLHQQPTDNYHSQLMNEYAFLAKKYKLEGHELDAHRWKFLRLRPANFPTVRLAQLAAFIHHTPHIFDTFLSFSDKSQWSTLFQTKPSPYWQKHYNFGKPSAKLLHGMGSSSSDNILINSCVPLLAAYSIHINEPEYMDKATHLLENLKPESNHITKKWKERGVDSVNAFDSQALIEIYNRYCLKKRCLSCKIGVGIIHQKCRST